MTAGTPEGDGLDGVVERENGERELEEGTSSRDERRWARSLERHNRDSDDLAAPTDPAAPGPGPGTGVDPTETG